MAKQKDEKKSKPASTGIGQMLASDIPIGGTGAPTMPPDIWRLINRPGPKTPAEEKHIEEDKQFNERLKKHGGG